MIPKESYILAADSIQASHYKLSCVYIISSLADPSKFYIGSTIDFGRRRSGHKSALRKNNHGNSNVQKHYNKYGEADFVFEILELVPDKSKLFEREQFYFDLLNPTLNVGKIAAVANLGIKWDEEKKAKHSKLLKGKGIGAQFTEQHKSNLSAAFKGMQRSLGRVLSKETKEKIAQSLVDRNVRGYKQTEEQVKNRLGKIFRKVINTETNKVYDSITEAAAAEGINRMTLCGWLIDTRRNKTPLRYYDNPKTHE